MAVSEERKEALYNINKSMKLDSLSFLNGIESVSKNMKSSIAASTETMSATRDSLANINYLNNEIEESQERIEDLQEAALRDKKSTTQENKTVKAVTSFINNSVKKPVQALYKLLGGILLANLPIIVDRVRAFAVKFRLVTKMLSQVGKMATNYLKNGINILSAMKDNFLNFDPFDQEKRLRDAWEQTQKDSEKDWRDLEDFYNLWDKDAEDVERILNQLEADTPRDGEPRVRPMETIDGRRVTGGMGMPGNEIQRAASLLTSYEGFRANAYPDPATGGAPWTIGYGSTRIGGRAVQPGDTITRQQAYEQKMLDLQMFRAKAIAQVGGEDKWNSLSDDARVSLLSIVYNYGEIPNRIIDAVMSGQDNQIADAIEFKLSGDNGGINRWRRQDEANFIRNGTSTRAESSGVSIPAAQAPVAPSPEPQTSSTGGGVMPAGSLGGRDANGQGLTNVLTSKDFNTMDPSVPSQIIRTSNRGMRNGRHHAGLDFGTGGQRGWYCGLMLSGTVSFVGNLNGYGLTVIINAGGKDFLFAHLARYSPGIRQGAAYNSGQPIGEVGNTGRSSGIHLHWEVRTTGGGAGTDIDPEPFVRYLVFGKPGAVKSSKGMAKLSAANVGTFVPTGARTDVPYFDYDSMMGGSEQIAIVVQPIVMEKTQVMEMPVKVPTSNGNKKTIIRNSSDQARIASKMLTNMKLS